MTLVPKREYILLLFGDVLIFVASLWLTLALRYLEVPSAELFKLHLVPFSMLFFAWSAVFFLSGLYGRHTRVFRSRLTTLILASQTINMVIAALFFFFASAFGLAPKTILVLYLVVSFILIFVWRGLIFPYLPRLRPKGILIASGPDAKALADEIRTDPRAAFTFDHVIDTEIAPTHEIIQRACRVAEQEEITFLVADFTHEAVSASLPIIYNSVFNKRRFALIDAADLYEEVFERVPLSLISYEWVLGNISTSRIYDAVKRVIDILAAATVGVISLIIYPFVMLAIKLEDGGPIFIKLPRIGRYEKTIHIIKFRSMTGNDQGVYDASGKSQLSVTLVGRWLRVLRIDELPQIWNVFIGDLSFVGPRPEAPALGESYSARIPYYNARHLITPGLTGWAQIKHDRHPHHGLAVEETKEKLSYDLYYLKQRSLMLDIFIMLQTIRIVVTARGS